MNRWIWCMVFLSFLQIALSAAGPDSEEIIRNVERVLTDQKTVKADFEELFVWQLVGEKQSIKGEFKLKGDSCFRITTADQIIVSDGIMLWTYSKPTNRVLIDKVENAENEWLPQKLFLKTRKEYHHRFVGEGKVSDRKCYIIDFQAIKDDTYFPKMKVWVDAEKWIPQRIEQTDISKNRVVYTLSDVQTGLALQDSIFQFKAPVEAEIIDLR